ncbi:MAG: hypothetical protein AAFU77_08140 [Myxococcota bacterium]
MIREIAELLQLENFTVDDLFTYATNDEKIEPEASDEHLDDDLLQRAWYDHVSISIDKSLLRFLLKRLAKNGLGIAREFVVQQLISNRPEETQTGLNYLSAIGPTDAERRDLAKFAVSERCLSSYQRWQVLRWLYDRGRYPLLTKFAQQDLAYNRSLTWPYSVLYLARLRESHFFEELENTFTQQNDDLCRATIVAAFAFARKERRNAFVSRHSTDSELLRWAKRWAEREAQRADETPKSIA